MDRNEAARIDRAIAKYGRVVCLMAYDLSQQGEGPFTVGRVTGLTTQQANAAIDAGRYIVKQEADRAR